MAELLKGKAVADSLTETTRRKVTALREAGTVPVIALVRIGENHGDVFYERGAVRRAAEAGIEVRKFTYGQDVTEDEFLEGIRRINEDGSIHGALIFRPLPGHIDDGKVCAALSPDKDVDGITPGSMAGVFMDGDAGYPPCTAEACLQILKYYGEELSGRRVTVIGRSLVIGKPVAMMAMRRDATVTVCHSRSGSEALRDSCAGADIIIAALGKGRAIGPEHLGRGKVIVDVGINEDENGKLCGDVDFERVEPSASRITPVPGGVGSVTTAVLMKHVADAACRKQERE